MLYIEFINRAIDETIVQADNELWYLEPLWRNILRDNQMDVADISDIAIGWDEIFNVLKLEAKKRNMVYSKVPVVVDWLYEVITTQVEPAMLEEEADYMKQMMEFIKKRQEPKLDK